MSEMRDFLKQLGDLYKKHPEYKIEAYNFVMTALHFTLEKMNEQRHISGQELSLGIRDYAREQFGPLAKTVFEHWGVYATRDFGHIVYNMIEAGLMTKTEEDSLEDFYDVYDFNEAFLNDYEYDI